MAVNINISTTFTGDTDTPNSYSGQSGKVLSVKSDETGLQFDSLSPSVILYEEVAIDFSNINDIYKGIILIGNSDSNRYIDVVKIAWEFNSNNSSLIEQKFMNMVGNPFSAIQFYIGDEDILNSPFTVEYTVNILNTISSNLSGVSAGTYLLSLDGGYGTSAEISVEINSTEQIIGFEIIDTGAGYLVNDELFIPANSPIGNINAISLGVITRTANNVLSSLFVMNFTNFFQYSKIAMTLLPLTGLSAKMGGVPMSEKIASTRSVDRTGKDLKLRIEELSDTSPMGISLPLVGGEDATLTIKIWYELRKLGTEL